MNLEWQVSADTFDEDYVPDEEEMQQDCIMTVEDFVGCCECGAFIDYDGYASLMKDGKETGGHVSPSSRHTIPVDITHIMWHNR